MRRAPIVLTSTVVGTFAVLTFKPHQPELSASAVASAAPADGSTSSAGSTGSSSGSTDSSSGSSSSSGSTDSSSDSSSSSSASSTGTHTATGKAIDTVYGAAQVRVTVTGGQITKVEAVQLQSADPKSVQISNYAAPLLAQSALDKQSGDVDAVSGATYTSSSYEASLQSALDKLGFESADGSRGSEATDALLQGGHDHGHGGEGGGPGGGFH
jgi:uncharacterized protein with FMN-binding domain